MTCAICEGEITVRRDYIFQSGAFERIYKDGRVFTCQACGLIQVDVAGITNSELTEYYRTAYRADAGIVSDQSQANQAKYKGRAKAILDAANRHLTKPPLRIFEVGAGYGYNLRAMGDAYPAAELVTDELDQDLQGAMGARSGSIDDGPYDVVILSHVLEHFLSPIDLLSRAAGALSVGGVLVIEVPNDQDGISVITACDEPHLTFFGPDTLQNALNLSMPSTATVVEMITSGPVKASASKRTRLRRWLGYIPGALPLLDRLRRPKSGVQSLPDYSTPVAGGIFLRAVVRRI